MPNLSQSIWHDAALVWCQLREFCGQSMKISALHGVSYLIDCYICLYVPTINSNMALEKLNVLEIGGNNRLFLTKESVANDDEYSWIFISLIYKGWPVPKTERKKKWLFTALAGMVLVFVGIQIHWVLDEGGSIMQGLSILVEGKMRI